MTTTLLMIDASDIKRRKYDCYLTSDRPCNYLIIEADTITKAKELCEQKKPNLILLSWQFPDGNGLEFLDWMKQQGQISLIPTLLLVNQKDEHIAAQSTKSGIQDYLVKEHLTPERLMRSLDNLLERMQLLSNVSDVVNLRKRAEAIKLENEEKFLCLVQCSDDVIWSIDLEGKFIYLSPQFKELFDWEPNEWIGRSIIDLVHQGDRPRFTDNVQNVLASASKSEMPVEIRHLQKDGSYVWVSTHMTAVKNYQRDVIAIQGILRDISDRISLAYAIRERKLVETRLNESNEALAAMNQELIRAAQQKKEFLTDISHELRTSLNAVLGSIECLQEGVYGDLNDKQRKILQVIEHSENHLLTLIDKVIYFSQSE
jgi:PAS domain S-box-containing protein